MFLSEPYHYLDACGVSVGAELELAGGEEHTLDLVLEPTARIHVRVRDASEGRPAEGVRVSIEGHARSPVVWGPAGEFALAVPRARSRTTLRAVGDGVVAERVVFDPLPGDGADATVELLPGRTASGTVLDVDGTPLAEVFVAAVADEWRGRKHLHDRVVFRTDANDRFTLRGLRRDLAHTLLAAFASRETAALRRRADTAPRATLRVSAERAGDATLELRATR